MNPLLIALSISFFIVFLFVVVIALWLLKLSKATGAKDQTSSLLMQQQLEALRAQLAESMNRVNDVTNQQLGTLASQMREQMNAVNQGMQSTSGQISQRLDNYQQVVHNVSRQLGTLSEATQKIFDATKNIASLEEILKPPKMRGGMGEIMLENILKEILPSERFYAMQHAFKGGAIVDAVINLNEGLIPIDAKFPLENFRKMIETKDESEKKLFRKEFVRNIKKHIDDIAKKYILPDEGTFNFALMYVPAENVYYEIIIKSDDATDNEDLYSYSTKRHVFPVSPNSIYPYLMTLVLGFRGLKIEKQANEILTEISRISLDIEKFTNDFKLIGTHLSNAQKIYHNADRKIDQIGERITVIKDKEGESLPAPEVSLLDNQK